MHQATTQQEALLQRLRKLQVYGPEFGRGASAILANHLPMALRALHRLHASDEQLDRFEARYRTRLRERTVDSLEINRESWIASLGQHRFHNAYLRFFQHELTRLGRDELFAQYLPTLFAGVAGGAFHPLIRLGYALLDNDDDEVAEAMAYWALAYLPLPEVRFVASCDRSPWEALLWLRKHSALSSLAPTGGNIVLRMEAVAATASYGVLGEALAPSTLTLSALAHTFLRVFARSHDFTALHLVTGMHAFRYVHAVLPKEHQALAVEHFWKAAVTAFLSTEVRLIEEEETPAEAKRSWEQLFAIVRNSMDDHEIKLVFSCYEESLHYNDPLYLQTADSFVPWL